MVGVRPGSRASGRNPSRLRIRTRAAFGRGVAVGGRVAVGTGALRTAVGDTGGEEEALGGRAPVGENSETVQAARVTATTRLKKDV
jgi:hypothetical protein